MAWVCLESREKVHELSSVKRDDRLVCTYLQHCDGVRVRSRERRGRIWGCQVHMMNERTIGTFSRASGEDDGLLWAALGEHKLYTIARLWRRAWAVVVSACGARAIIQQVK